MRILVLANNDLGLYNFRKELIEKLIELNSEVHISLPQGPKILELKELGCQYIETAVDRRGINPIKDLKLLLKYIKIIRNIKPDYVLTYTIKPNIYGGIACRITKTKQIANITGLGTALENKGILQKTAIALHRIALKKVKCCFAQNQANLEFLQKQKIARNKLKLIPGSGVNLDRFKLLDYPKESEPIEFLFISRIMKEKGIDQYLETAEYIKNKYPNTKFHILGFCEQEYNEKLNEFQNKNIIEYHGRQDNITPFMQKASCIIHPTYYPEGMSNVLLEACASGRPIITTNRAGCREIVDNGINGYVIKEKDSKDLIEKVEKFINLSNEEKKQMGLNGRKKVENEFDRDIVIKKYMEEIRKMSKKVSVIVTVYNMEKYIKQCLDSIVNQTYKNIEILIINDGSTDSSLKIINQYKKNYTNIKIFNQQNGGPSMAKNVGLRNAMGDYILFVDADDWIDMDFVEKLMLTAQEDDLDILFFDSIKETENKKNIGIIKISQYKKNNKEEILKMHITGRMPAGSHKIIKKEIVTKSNATFDDNLKNGEELQFTIQILLQAKKIGFLKEPFYHCTQRMNSQSRKERKNFENNISSLYNILNRKNIFQKYEAEYKLAIIKFMLLEIYNEAISNSFKYYKLNEKKILDSYKCKYDIKSISQYKYLDRKSQILYALIRYKFCFIVYKIINTYSKYKKTKY